MVRVYDGTIVAGRFIGPDGYANFLRGALAEASGDLGTALGFYERAADDDGDDPMIWARIGELRCRRQPGDRAADDAFARARKSDDGYAGALGAEARCEALRGHRDRAETLTREASAADPRNVDLVAQWVALESQTSSGEGRARAVALTREHGEREAAWDALAQWARAHRDAPLFAEALRGLLAAAPGRSPDVERGAIALLGDGHRRLAEEVAAAVADAPRELLVRGPREPVVARLAIDQALGRGDGARAEQRASRGRVPLSEVAGRASLLGQGTLARELAERVRAADPSSSGAELVRVAESVRFGDGVLRTRSDLPPLACVLAFTRRLAVSVDVDAARAFFEAMPRAAALAHDPLVNAALVDLAARGAVPDGALPVQAAIELAARRRTAPPTLGESVDPVHRLLWMALTQPHDEAAGAQAERLVPAADDDATVAFSVAAIARSRGGPDATAAVSERLTHATATFPADPLLLALAVETTGRGGHSEAARTRLMAVAQTDAERALARP